MNFSQLELGEDYKISFGLNIAGTSTPPSEVRVCLGDDIKIVSIARLNASSNEYEASVPVIPQVAGNKTTLTIEIILNGKLLVPYREAIDLNAPSVSVSNVKNDPTPIEAPAEIVVTPVVDTRANDFINMFNTEVKETKALPAAEENVSEVKETLKEVKRQIEFTAPKKRDKIETQKPITIDFSELSEAAPVVPKTKVQPSITELKISKAPFKLTKTKIIER